MSKGNLLRVKVARLGGKKIIDLRWCIQSPSGLAIPTKRGFSLPYEKLDELMAKLGSANGIEEFINLEEDE